MVFDLMYLDRRELCHRPLRERRARLEDLVAGNGLVFAVRRLSPNGLDAWDQVLERQYEGYVAKNEASPYQPGATRLWLKVKRPGWAEGRRWQ
jgi:bifunctional non-homologous end joining protein LigD